MCSRDLWNELLVLRYCTAVHCLARRCPTCSRTLTSSLPAKKLRWILVWMLWAGNMRLSCQVCAFVLLRATAGTAIARLSHRNSVRLSVCPSVTWVDQAKTVQARIIKSSPSAAPRTLVSGSVTLFQKFHRDSPQSRALNERGVGKFCDFEPITGHISETVRDRAKVTINH